MMKGDKERAQFSLPLSLSFVMWRPHEYGNQLLFAALMEGEEGRTGGGGSGVEKLKKKRVREKCLTEVNRSPEHLFRCVVNGRR